MTSTKYDQYTDEDFITAMREAVEDRGADYVYPAWLKTVSGLCQYVAHGQSACIVGVAIEKMTGELYLKSNASADAVLEDHFPGITQSVRTAAREAQVAQDEGKPWSDALALFEEYRVVDL